LIAAHIRNIIFDLGGVILNLSVSSTMKELAALTGLPLEKIVDLYASRDEFLQYEKGLISDEEFRHSVRDIYKFKGNDHEIDRCWNAMLLDIPAKRIALLKKLKSKYRTFLLSNTNAIHVEYFSADLHKAHGMHSLDELFEKVYYSHVLNMRKPDADIYLHVLKASGLVAGETLFLDDNEKNIAGARSVGIETMLVKDPDELFEKLA
jgi:epoxide hydrolase-like predicted phosphatase